MGAPPPPPPPRHKQPRVDPHALPLPGVLQSPANPTTDASGATDDPLHDDGAWCPGVSPGASRGLRAGLRPAGLADAPGALGKRRRKPRKTAKPTKAKVVRMAPGAIPGAASVVGELFTVSGRNPFRIPGPAVISFSGGRTSAMMLRKILDAYGGVLPPDVHVIFANTGCEDPRTLDFVRDCAERWGVWVRWLEYDPDAPSGYREVDYDTASRDGTPFSILIHRKSALPNGRMRFCTQELKLKVMRNFMRDEGYADDEWINTVGLRADEAIRVITLRARPETKWDIAAPLYDAGVVKADVMAFWNAQPFDLLTPTHLGNCGGCFLKGKRIRETVAATNPEVFAWWIEHEERAGRLWVHKEPEGYAGMLKRVRLRVVGQGAPGVAGDELGSEACELDAEGLIYRDPEAEYDPEDDVALPCDCTQRRPAPKRRCRCGKRPGQGHTLACPMGAFGDDVEGDGGGAWPMPSGYGSHGRADRIVAELGMFSGCGLPGESPRLLDSVDPTP